MRIPSLDGLRAISITMVIVTHMAMVGTIPYSNIFLSFAYGHLGVRVFFVISGFLITTLLMQDMDRTGTISLRQFYLRRAFRIMPAYYAFIAITAFATVFGWIDAPLDKIFSVAVYLSNYDMVDWTWAHTWSLAVEEQFYLLWPAVVLLVTRNVTIAAATAMIAAPVFRILVSMDLWPGDGMHQFEVAADAIATGCLLALVREQAINIPHFAAFIRSALMPLAVLAGLAATMPFDNVAMAALKPTALNIAIALLIERYIREPETVTGRILNSRPLCWIGLLSYSLYLWQQVLCKLPFGINLAAMLVAASASYYLIEKPALQLRTRISGESLGHPVRKLDL